MSKFLLAIQQTPSNLDDIKPGQTAGNYEYDEIGNLIADDQEDITEISWTVGGKIEYIHADGKYKLEYDYDALGNRIRKRYYEFDNVSYPLTKTTMYVKDASGQSMSIYERAEDTDTTTYQAEIDTYGSSRHGSVSANRSRFATNTSFAQSRELGDRSYTLTDHLGNVRALVVDWKSKNLNDFEPQLLSYSNYYPFGMLMPERTASAEEQRYGFSGQERENEILGVGNSYSAEFWQYDSRLARRWNIDPVRVSWESPYSTFRSNPILFNDPSGDCPTCRDGKYEIKQGDTFWELEEEWGMEHGTLQGYNPEIEPRNLQIGSTIVVSPNSAGNFVAGTGTPEIKHDNGFADFPKEEPTLSDRMSYAYWRTKANTARVLRPDLVDGLDAYDHYTDATGSDKTFDLSKFFSDDPSGAEMLKNSIELAVSASEEILPYSGVRDLGVLKPFYVGAANSSFNIAPYPATENWQKAIGAFPFYMTGIVTANEVEGKLEYTLVLTIHVEDRYNFNPGQEDIETGVPDNVNGRFEVIGWAKQYMHYGTFTKTIQWTK